MTELSEVARRQSARQVEIRRAGPGAGVESDWVATEEPLEIRVGFTRADGSRGERSISVTMRTPGKDDELAAGFLYTEGIVRSGEDIVSVGPCGPPAANGLVNVVRVELAESVAVDLDQLERHFYTSSSCGVCGKASIEAVAVQGRYDIHAVPFTIERALLNALPDMLIGEQSIFERTGGLHASGQFDAGGRVLCVREDVGRHNALDKLIGMRFVAGELPLFESGILVSGRASFELMQKAMMAGCPFLAAVGAPSSLAVEMAAEFGMTLVGFLKRDRFNIYSRPDRVV